MRYNMSEVLFAAPVIQLGTMCNIEFGVMIDVAIYTVELQGNCYTFESYMINR